MNKDIKEIYITKEQIIARSKEIAKEIDEAYKDKHPVIIVLLKGSIPFSDVLTQELTIPVNFDYIKVSSYKGTKSTGNVSFTSLPTLSLKGRHLIVVEDIIDTGNTLAETLKVLNKFDPASIEIVTLLDKPSRRINFTVKPRWSGFVIPDEFVVGFGLDYNEEYRELPYVGILKEEVYNK